MQDLYVTLIAEAIFVFIIVLIRQKESKIVTVQYNEKKRRLFDFHNRSAL